MDTLTIRFTVQTPCIWALFAALVLCAAAELGEPAELDKPAAADDEEVTLAEVTDDIGIGRLAVVDTVAAASDCMLLSMIIAEVCFVVPSIPPYPDGSKADEGLGVVSCGSLVNDEMAALVLVTDLV